MAHTKERGFFITLEGPDGCGKSTQARLLKETLLKKGCLVVHTREPGGTSFAESVRGIILNPNYKISPTAELLLYEASRAQHVEEVILPALASGQIVLCERFCDATVAYQGYGRGLPIKLIKTLNGIASGGLKPNLTLVLDIPACVGLSRARAAKGNGGKGDRLEQENIKFHNRVRKGYLTLASQEPKRVRVISAAGSVEKVRDKIWGMVTDTGVCHRIQRG